MKKKLALLIGALVMLSMASAYLFSMSNAPKSANQIRAENIYIHLKRGTFDPRKGEMNIPTNLKAGKDNNLFIVQFNHPVGTKEVWGIEHNGFKIIGYIPDFAYLVAGERGKLKNIESLQNVYWMGDYHPYYKISPRIKEGNGEYTVTILIAHTDTAKSTFMNIVKNYDVMGMGRNPFTDQYSVVIKATYKQIEDIAKMNDVYWIEPWMPMHLADETSSEIVGGYWSQNSPWDGPGNYVNSLGWNGSVVVVSITDTGIANGQTPVDHPDFQNRVMGGIDYTGSGSWEDDHAHGTHVAGIVGANGALGTGEQYPGTTYYVGMGVAPNVTLFAQRVFDGGGNWAFSNDTYMFWLAQQAYDNGVYVSQNSWGANTQGDYNSDDVGYDQIVRDSSSHDTGDQPIIYVFAAGNAGSSAQTVGSPGSAKNVITVGATENYWQNPTSHGYQGSDSNVDNPDEMASFSSRGPAADGRIKPDVSAPGVGILSTRSSKGSDTLWGVYDSYYLWCDGTSQATPHISGAVADIVQWWMSNFGQKPSPAMAKAMLINSAVDIAGGPNGGGNPIPNYDEGWGRAFLPTLLDPQVNVIYHDQDALLQTGQTYSINVRVQDATKPFKVTLVWTDVAGTASANPALVNDLNLEVIAPNGDIYYGNAFKDGWSVPNTSAGNSNIGASWDNNGDKFDDRNNVECVFINTSSLQSGMYTVEVIGYNIPQDAVSSTSDIDQDFALVVYNAQQRTDLPDLTLSPNDISFSNSNPNEGDMITITATVHNVGNNDSYNVNVSFYYDNVDSSHIIGTVNYGNIPQGGSATNSINWDTSGMAGIRNVIVYADSTHSVAEIDEMNNSASKSITVNGYAVDLSCVHNESAAQAGRVVVYDITVTNTGTMDDTYSLTVTNPSGWMYSLSTDSVSLTPGNNSMVSLKVFIPDTANPGDRGVIGVKATSQGNSAKSDEVYTTTTVTNAILFVDDDVGNNYETYFENALDADGYQYDVWDVSSQGSPGLSDMEDYMVVIWNTGADWSSTLSDTDQNNLMQYLDSGGRLYLSSQDFLWEVSGGNDGTISNTFVNNYLHVTAVSNDVAYSSVQGVNGDPISDGFGTITLNYPYTNYADEITIDSSAYTIFTNPSSDNTVADRVDNGTWRLVFTAFSFEAVENQDSSTGAQLMDRIVTWLMEGGAGTPGKPLSPSVTAGAVYLNLTWQPPSSNGGSPITGYNIYRKEGASGTYVFVATVPSTQLYYNDTAVTGGKTYYYFVTATNSVGEGAASDEVSGTPPAIPELNYALIMLAMGFLLFIYGRKKRVF